MKLKKYIKEILLMKVTKKVKEELFLTTLSSDKQEAIDKTEINALQYLVMKCIYHKEFEKLLTLVEIANKLD